MPKYIVIDLTSILLLEYKLSIMNYIYIDIRYLIESVIYDMLECKYEDIDLKYPYEFDIMAFADLITSTVTDDNIIQLCIEDVETVAVSTSILLCNILKEELNNYTFSNWLDNTSIILERKNVSNNQLHRM